MRHLLAALAIVALPLAVLPTARTAAEETIILTEEHPGSLDLGGADGCGCRGVQRPPWHGNVRGTGCGQACGTGCGGVYHANPCGQLHLRRFARENCMTLPPCFPRMHALCAEGFMPTPPPPAMPRCHQCGAVIEGGF
ncbi:MAG: hypothetical protein EBR28_09145 [Planctomycetia bacterium]|nr:hypothetical protein [Planctomycetia bacterium]